MVIKILTYCFFASSICLAVPGWKTSLTSQSLGKHAPLPSSTMQFSLSWKGMLKAGELEIQIAPPGEKKRNSLIMKAHGSSLGPAAAIYPFTFNYWSELDSKTFRSKYFAGNEKDHEEALVNKNRYYQKSVNVSEVSKANKTGKINTKKFTFPYGPARDVFSALLHIRSQSLTPGEEHVLLVLPFKSPYILKVRSEAYEKHMGRDAIRLSASLHKIDTDTHELKTYKKLKKPVSIWLSNDTDRVLLEIRASAFIGDVRATLTNFTKNP